MGLVFPSVGRGSWNWSAPNGFGPGYSLPCLSSWSKEGTLPRLLGPNEATFGSVSSCGLLPQERRWANAGGPVEDHKDDAASHEERLRELG